MGNLINLELLLNIFDFTEKFVYLVNNKKGKHMELIRKKIKAYRLFGNKKLHPDVDTKELSPFLINYYDLLNTEQRIKTFITIINTFLSVQQHNDKREVNYSKPDLIIQPPELLIHFNSFIDFFLKQKDSTDVIKFIAKNNKELFFRILGVHSQNFEKTHELINFLCIADFLNNISYEDFLIAFQKYNCQHCHSTEAYCYFFEKFILNSEDNIQLFLKDYHSNYKHYHYDSSFELSIAIGHVLGAYLNKNPEYKKDFFNIAFANGVDFDSLYHSKSIREYMDKDCIALFSEKLYASIPDNYSKIKEDFAEGISTTMKLLKEFPEYSKKPEFRILDIIRKGEVKKRFYESMQIYSEYDFAEMVKIFKIKFPNLYKATFINKNPPFVSPTKPETRVYLDKVLLIMNMGTVGQHKQKQKRI